MSLPARNLLVVALASALTVAAAAAEASRPAELEPLIYQSYFRGDYDRAAELIEQYLQAVPHDPVMLYNAACVYSLRGERARAASALFRAVKAGWSDLDQIVREPALESLRNHPTYLAVVERLEPRESQYAYGALHRWRNTYGQEQYRYETDQARGIAYATALDPTSHREMRQMLELEADHLRQTLLGTSPRPFFLIAVPTPQDADRLFRHDHIGGLYDHSKRELVARDIGGSLRHEFVHALHYAHMDALDQQHPLWVQEGLASLYEDYVFDEDGSIVFVANERHNFAKGLASVGWLTRWSDLFEMSDDRFMAKAIHHYPQVRSIFEFLADKGKLTCWYQALIEHFDDDPTGAKAFTECFGMSVVEVESAWRRWLAARPGIDTSIDAGDAALGIESRPNARNDGVLITRLLPRSAAARAQLSPGDVIVAVDAKPTRSLPELQAIIAAKRVGDTVRIRARRDGNYFAVVVSLQPLQPMIW